MINHPWIDHFHPMIRFVVSVANNGLLQFYLET